MDDADRAQALIERERDALLERQRAAMQAGSAPAPPEGRDCRDCGEAIAAARLRVLPRATRCVDCQRLFEDRHA